MSGDVVKATLFDFLKGATRVVEKTGEVVADVARAGARELDRAMIEYNPLGLSLGDVVLVRKKEYAGNQFVVDAINVTAREILGERYVFADYNLVDKRGDETWIMLRVIPKERTDFLLAGAYAFLLVPQFEGGYGQYKKMHDILKKGKFPVKDTGRNCGYRRPEGPIDPNIGTVREYTKDGKKESSVQYWDFTVQADDGEHMYLIEMDENGWFQTYEGLRVDLGAIEPLSSSL